MNELRTVLAKADGEDVVVIAAFNHCPMPIEDGDELLTELLLASVDARKERGRVDPPIPLIGAIATWCSQFTPTDTLPTMERLLDMAMPLDAETT